MSWSESWERRDPFTVVARKQEQEIKRDTRIVEEHMGRKLEGVSERIQQDMYQWGAWAKRPQFWANLRVTPFFRLLGMQAAGEPKDIPLDPLSMAIHKAVMSLDDKYKVVLYAYYVQQVTHDAMADLFNKRGISRATFYRRLEAGSVLAHNKGKRLMEAAKLGL